MQIIIMPTKLKKTIPSPIRTISTYDMTLIKYYFHRKITRDTQASGLEAQQNLSCTRTNLYYTCRHLKLVIESYKGRYFLTVNVTWFRLHIWQAPSRDSVRSRDKSLRENRFAPPLHTTRGLYSDIFCYCCLLSSLE